MAGIKYLSDIYEKKGKSFIESLFNKDVTVTENLDGSSFSFERDFTGDNISFYKKDQDNPITRVDRILMKYYEKPINYIEALPDEIKSQIPKGWRFGMAYFPSTKPVRIEYDRIPKNHLILTHIISRDEFGDVIKNIQDKEELDEWADKLGVERSPVIFQGKLNRDQKISIMDFLSTPLMDLKSKFKTESFTKYIVSILNRNLEKTTLGNDLRGSIDSLVFRFESDDEEEVEQEIEEIPVEAEEEEEFQEIQVGPEDDVDPEIVNRIKAILNTDHHREIPSTDDNSVNLVIGKFHPFNNGHLKLIKKANQHNGLPVCVFVAKCGHR